MAKLILASASRFRRALMENAGLRFDVIPANIDERAIDADLVKNKTAPSAVAQRLADEKAMAVSTKNPQALVIGSDQTLSMEHALFHKPKDMDAAKQQILSLNGRTHHLHSAISMARGNAIIWRHVSVANLTCRQMTADFVDDYLARAGETILSCVGAYQYDGLGIQLFDKIEGDYFTVIGLPMLPLLAELRSQGAING